MDSAVLKQMAASVRVVLEVPIVGMLPDPTA
jgi:hypothetical protein